MSIKSKLYAGFALLVLIAVALAVYGITEFNGIGANVAKMNALAENTTRVLQIEHDLEMVRRSALRFTYDHDEAAAKENGEVASRVVATLRDAAQATLSEERRKLYNGLQSDVATNQTLTQSLFDTVKKMEAEQEKLHDAGNELTDTTATIVAKARNGGDEEVISLGDKLCTQLLAVRVANGERSRQGFRDDCGTRSRRRSAVPARPGWTAQGIAERVCCDGGVLHQAPAASTRSVRQQDRAAGQRDAGRHREGARSVAGSL
jgi:Four helix bundle sensory module for signal transduction